MYWPRNIIRCKVQTGTFAGACCSMSRSVARKIRKFNLFVALRGEHPFTREGPVGKFDVMKNGVKAHAYVLFKEVPR